MKKVILSVCVLLVGFSSLIQAQHIKSPSEFLGYELGTRFTRHHKVVDYFKYVSSISKNVKLEKYGETNEFRPLYVVYISSEENIANIENIRENNLKQAGIVQGTAALKTGIVWLSYNVHGNEASSTEAAMQTMYTLITTKSEWLKNTLVIIDPCVNPDGRDRYVNWYNQTKSTPYDTNPDAIEHHEPWPGGRPNHYLFDLNRDWAWATQVETQQRLMVYNKWLPHVHVDFHEQYINNPYYFAPAVEPFHEIITDWQRSFQTQIGKNHAKYFDKNGWRYFTKESFDLFYPSYGDTYPTYMGAVGMTYEQAGHGKAGLGIDLANGAVLTLVDRVKHHTTTGLSTVEVASKNTTKLITEFGKFFNNTNLKYKNYIVRGNHTKINQVVSLLNKHQINSYRASQKTIKAFDYYTGTTKSVRINSGDLVISTNQPKGKMVKVLFEPEAKLSDSLTYDITAWSIPFAYGLHGFATTYSIEKSSTTPQTEIVKNNIQKTAYAYVCKWDEVADAAFLGKLLEADFKVRFSHKKFSVDGNQFERGSLVILRGENKHLQNFDELITDISNQMNEKLTPASTGFVDYGADFGSDYVAFIEHKKVAVISGEGTSSLSFGEIWHFFETQLQYPLHIINTAYFNHTDLDEYNVLILPNGFRASEKQLKKITSFAEKGGNVIAIGSALNSFADKEGFNLKRKKDDDESDEDDTAKKDMKKLFIPYNQLERESVKSSITGSIFKSTIDNTHPLAYGYTNTYYSLKLSASAYDVLEDGFNVGYFPEGTTTTSGFAGVEALEKVQNSLLFGIEYQGKGKIIYMVDNPLFRSFWEHGKLFVANAIFFN
ncbi:M14 family metallopeptidase [Lutibacter sp.]